MSRTRHIINLRHCVAALRGDTTDATETLQRYLSGFSRTLLGTIAAQASTYLSMTILARMLGLES